MYKVYTQKFIFKRAPEGHAEGYIVKEGKKIQEEEYEEDEGAVEDPSRKLISKFDAVENERQVAEQGEQGHTETIQSEQAIPLQTSLTQLQAQPQPLPVQQTQLLPVQQSQPLPVQQIPEGVYQEDIDRGRQVEEICHLLQAFRMSGRNDVRELALSRMINFMGIEEKKN